MTILTDEVEVICPHCNKHFALRMSEDKQGLNLIGFRNGLHYHLPIMFY